jgi:hypothetical protein
MTACSLVIKTLFNPFERIKLIQQTREVWQRSPSKNIEAYSAFGILKGMLLIILTSKK